MLQKNEQRIITLHDDHSPDYSVEKVGLPLKESHLIQIEPGNYEVALHMATVGCIGMVRNAFDVESIGINVLNPNYIAFAIPECWTGDFLINGEPACQHSFFMTGDLDSFHFHSLSRITMGVTLPRQPFVEAIAALSGLYVEDINLNDRKFNLSIPDSFMLKTRLKAIIDKTCNHPEKCSQAQISNEVIGILTDAYLRALPDSRYQTRRVKQSVRIVRLAEERFMATLGKQVSLADLCLAAGVKKSTLYQAFQNVCRLSPLSYFQKRRLIQTRSLLLKEGDIRGGVKRAALSYGFTELGRFSSEYQQLFGELPSITLSRTYL